MSEKNKLSFNEGEEEEFHITDEDIDRELAAMETDHAASPSEEAPSEIVTETPESKDRFAALKQLKRKHWIIILAIAIVLLFGLLKFIGGRQETSFTQITPVSVAPDVSAANTQKTKTDLTQQDMFEPSKSKPATAASNTLLAAPTLSAPVAATSAVSNDVKVTQVLEAIQRQNQLLTQQLTALSSRVVGLESNLVQSSQAVQGLSQQMGTLKQADRPAPPLPRLAQSVPMGPQYTVEAVVPQRAWLQTGDGSTITVMIGDDLPGLGAVVSIDPYSGNVTTASGTVIKYGS